MHARDKKSDGQQPGPSEQTEQSTNKFIAESTFVEDTLDNRNYQVWLEQEDIANIARIEYGWYGENGNVFFEVIGSVEQLKTQLVRYKDILKEKQSLTFIINLNNYHWVTLVITHQNQQFSAYYIDSLWENLPCNINKALKDVVEDINIRDFKAEQQHDGHNCGIFALENARVINEALQNSREPQATDLSNLQLTDDRLKTRREEFARALRRRDRIESKFEVLLKFLKELNEHQSKMENFNYQNANILLLFLETLALQDPTLQDPVSKLCNYEQKLVDQGIIDREDLERVQYIRSGKIFHRKAYSVIDPADFRKIVNLNQNNEVKKFFQDLEKYVQQTYTKLKGEMADQSNLKKPTQLFKSKNENEQFGKTIARNQLRKNILTFFKGATAKECYRDDRLNLEKVNEMMFKFLVNVIPFIGEAYKKPAEPLEEIKWFRGNLIHKFYEFGDNYKLMGVALKNFMRDYKGYFFKYYYSQKVCNVLKETKLSNKAETINKKLKSSLKEFQNKFGKEYLAAKEDIDKENSFEFVASELVHSEINNKSALENCIHEYFKLMSIIDNEKAIKEREKKYKESNVPARYKELSGNDRREIYEDFRLLKDLFKMSEKGISGSKNTYDKKKKLLLKKFKKSYGILKDDFNVMIKSYVENDDYSSVDGENTVTNALLVFKEIKKHHSNLSNQDIIGKFNERKSIKGNKGSPEEKISSIPEGKTIKISVPSGKTDKTETVSINTDRFTQNIFEMFNNAYIQYRLVFNNIEGAFNDEIFLDYLANENVGVSEGLIEKLLKIDYMVPYVARLVTKDELINRKIITNEGFLETIEKLLKGDSYIKHLKKLLKEGISDKEKKINGKKLKSILKPNDKKYNENNIKSVFYEQICDRIISNDVNIENMYLIFEEPEYTEGILSALGKKIKSDTAADRETAAGLIKKILKLLNSIANELYNRNNKEELVSALQLLDGKNGAQEARKSLVNEKLAEKNDLDILQAKRSIARIKNRQGRLETSPDKAEPLYKAAYGILSSMKNNIKESLPNNTLFLQFLLTLSDLAYTHHLLHECSQAYEIYEALYKEMIKSILNLSDDDLSRYVWSKEDYNSIVQSETYKGILKLSPKYLNILKIKSDMANELKCLANVKQRSLPNKGSQDYKTKPNEALQHYQSALNIYEEVYKIKEADATFGQDIVKTMLDIAYINNRLGRLKSSNGRNEEELQCALSHYEKALGKYKEIEKIQVQEKWETHPAVLETGQNIVKVMRNVAYTRNKLGGLKRSSNLEEALYHHNEALRIYEEVLDIQKRTLDEEHEYTLNTMSDIAYTNNNLAVLKSQDNRGEALEHYKKAIEMYNEKILKIQRKTLGKEHRKTERTKADLTQTETWMNDLQVQTPSDASQSESQIPEAIGTTDDNPETRLSGVTVNNQRGRSPDF